MDPVISTTTQNVLQCGGDIVKRHMGYLLNYNDTFEEVKHYIKMMENERNRVQNDVRVAEMNVEEIENDVLDWLKHVDEKIKKYESFIHDERHSKTRCFIGFFPNNLILRYRLGRNATKMVEEIKKNQLLNKSFEKVSYRVRPSIDVALSNIDYESLGSRNKILENIMITLEDSTVNMIGVYGVGGVGKTTLIKEVAKKAQEKKLFNMVVMASITINPDIKKIQGQIIGMRLEEESEIVRADRIRKRLNKEKEKTLIILDDLWSGLDMKRLGIPFSDDEDGCKIILTSRNKDVLCNMNVQQRSTFSIGVLDEKEAETLLMKVAGKKNSMFDVKAIEIAKMCAGLPIALVSIGRTLKNKSSFVWEDVYQQIRRHSFTEGQEPIEFCVKLSYDHLKNDQLKHIFLHCARMGNDALLMDLVKYCVGLGLLQGVHTIREARNKVNELIEELKKSSLLMESYSNDRFNMHDIVLDFLKIPDDLFKDMIKLKILILNGVDLSCLPTSIQCLAKLRMLSLERCTLVKDLSIIGKLKKLRILTFSGSNIESLPHEFGELDKLQVLDLSNCLKLRVIPSNIISRMNILEEFYMRDSLIPWETEKNLERRNASLSELRHLNQLQNLDIHIQSDVHFPQNLFFDRLDSYKIVIGEFNTLKVGELNIPDKYEVVKFLALNLKEGMNIHSEKWIKMLFKRVEYLLLGEINDVHDVFYELNVEGFPNLKHLSIVNNFSIEYIIKSMELAFPKLESMYLYKVENLEKICDSQLTNGSFSSLKSIKIKTCDQLKNLFPFSMVRLLTMLETIEVCDCDYLKEIVSVERQTHTIERQINTINDDKIVFPQLKFLTLQSLPTFSCLYTNDKMPSSAQSLEDQVRNKNKDIATNVSQDVIDTRISLFNEKVSIPKLERLELSSINIVKIWSDQSLHCFQNLLTLNVTNCGNLKYLMSLSMAESLVNLQSLFVCACEMMEDIFRLEDVETISFSCYRILMFSASVIYNMEEMVLSLKAADWMHKYIVSIHRMHKLQALRLFGLNNTKVLFWFLHRLPNLEKLGLAESHLESIWTPRSLVLEEKIGVVSQLKELTLTHMYSLVEIGFEHDQLLQRVELLVIHTCLKLTNLVSPSVSFSYLTHLEVMNCRLMRNLMTTSTAKSLVKLTTMKVSSCPMILEIVAKNEEEEVKEIEFRQLKSLELVDLQNIKSFCSLEKCDLKFPLLENLVVSNCLRMTKFSEVQSSPNLQKVHVVAGEKDKWYWEGDLNNTLQKIITDEVSFEYGKHARVVDYPEMKGVRHGKPAFPDNFCGSLKILEFDAASKRDIVIPSHVLPYLKSLEELNVYNSDAAQVIFDIDKTKGIVFRLKKLTLKDLSNLECVWKWNKAPQGIVNFPNLQEVDVRNCGSLVTLRMKYLLTFSIAKSLVQLEYLAIRNCVSIKEIIKTEDEDTSHEIIFGRLEYFSLTFLQSLVSFYSGNATLQFPCLLGGRVAECPNMKTFSEGGTINTPSIIGIETSTKKSDDIPLKFHNDLNTTIKMLFHQQVRN
uniref:Disease resistance protein At4g27220 family n=1 Tax=Cajanus cajan TaxID=3821 RepID=A0A151TBH7_CAJCA|nr:putative disease resistance protein At4g27220 family [Cajanus cajan]